MKLTLRRTSAILALMLCFLVPVSFHANADSYLDYNGKMDLKTDRVEKTTQEKIDNEKKSNEKTELEKYAPDLFKQQSTDAFKAQQKQIDVETKKLEDSLFVQSDKKDTAMKNIQEELFSKNYTTGTANTASLDTNPIDPFSKKVIIALSSLVFGICCGIYAVIKKIWE